MNNIKEYQKQKTEKETNNPRRKQNKNDRHVVKEYKIRMARCSVQENISGMIRTVSEAESIVNWQQ
jgi:hypothetical protein